MKKQLFILILALISGNIYSQEIINSLKKQAFDAADKKLEQLINKVINKDGPEKTVDTVSKVFIEKWDCHECGTKDNTGNFCRECGAKKPEPIEPWECTKCGKKGNTSKFCTECGTKRPEEWTCPDCSKKNTGNFCTDCGAKKPGSTNSEPKSSVPSKDYQQYIKDLTPSGIESWELELNLYKDETPSSTLSFSNYKDAINGILELPTAKWIVTSDSSAIWRIKQQNVEAALSIMTTNYSNSIINLQSAQIENKAEVIPELNISQEDKENALKQIGIDIQGATSDQIEASLIPYLSKKWEIPENDMAKILKMAGTDQSIAIDYIKDNYPSKLSVASNIVIDENKYAAIADSLKQLSIDIESSSHTTLEEDLKVLVEDISSSWISSEEAKNVIELEEALDDLMSKYKNSDDTTPSFWTEARKAENSVIQSWNMKQAIRWRKAIQAHLDIYNNYSTKLARYESELELLRNGGKYNKEYILAKTQCLSMISIIVKYVTMPAAVINIPLAKYVKETK